jgi:hypothetical protein
MDATWEGAMTEATEPDYVGKLIEARDKLVGRRRANLMQGHLEVVASTQQMIELIDRAIEDEKRLAESGFNMDAL